MSSSSEIAELIRRKYSLGRESYFQADRSEVENILKRQVVRLEKELQETQKENEQLRQEIRVLSCTQDHQESRVCTFDLEKPSLVKQEREDLLRDVSDLAKGNRYLSQENDVLTQKYSHLLDMHSKMLLQKQISTEDLFNGSSNPNSLNQNPISFSPQPGQRWSEVARLQEDYACNKRTIEGMFANLRETSSILEKERELQFDTREQWRNFALNLQVALENILRISNDQNNIHDAVYQMNQAIKNNDNISSMDSSNVKLANNTSQQQIQNAQMQTTSLKPSSPKLQSQKQNNLQSNQLSNSSSKSPGISKRIMSPSNRTMNAKINKSSVSSQQSQQLSQSSSSPRTSGSKKTPITESTQIAKKLHTIPEQDENQKVNSIKRAQPNSSSQKNLSSGKKIPVRPRTGRRQS